MNKTNLPVKLVIKLSEKDISKFSGEEILSIIENISFLSQQPPIKIGENFRRRKINYGGGHREIKISRGSKSVPVTRAIEIKNKWPRGLYNSTSDPDNFATYWVFDYAHVEGWEGMNSDVALVGMEAYLNRDEIKRLEKERKSNCPF